MATCNSIYYFIRLDDAELDEYLRGWGHDRAWFERLLLASAGPGAVPWVHDPKIEDGLPLYDFGIR